VKALLDSNTLLWSALDPDRLSPAAQQVVRPTENDLFLSAVTCIELVPKAEELSRINVARYKRGLA